MLTMSVTDSQQLVLKTKLVLYIFYDLTDIEAFLQLYNISYNIKNIKNWNYSIYMQGILNEIKFLDICLRRKNLKIYKRVIFDSFFT